jgi:hypothetical protein
MPTPFTAEQAKTPEDPRLTAYEAGRWYALHGRTLPGGTTMQARAGYRAADEAWPDAAPGA